MLHKISDTCKNFISCTKFLTHVKILYDTQNFSHMQTFYIMHKISHTYKNFTPYLMLVHCCCRFAAVVFRRWSELRFSHKYCCTCKSWTVMGAAKVESLNSLATSCQYFCWGVFDKRLSIWCRVKGCVDRTYSCRISSVPNMHPRRRALSFFAVHRIFFPLGDFGRTFAPPDSRRSRSAPIFRAVWLSRTGQWNFLHNAYK